MLRSVRPNAWKLRYGRVTVYRGGDVLRMRSMGIVECNSCGMWELQQVELTTCGNQQCFLESDFLFFSHNLLFVNYKFSEHTMGQQANYALSLFI